MFASPMPIFAAMMAPSLDVDDGEVVGGIGPDHTPRRSRRL